MVKRRMWTRRCRKLCTRWWTATLHLLEVAVYDYQPLLHGLHLLHPLFLILLVPLLQPHVPPVGLLELPLHWFIQCIHLITDVLYVGPSRPNSRHKLLRIWPAINSSHIVNLPLIAAANCLGPYLVITNRWAPFGVIEFSHIYHVN